MNVDFSQTLTGLKGEPVKDPTGAPVKLALVCYNAVKALYKDEEGLSGEEKYKRAKLAQKLDETNVELTAEDISMIKKLVGKAYEPEIVAATWDLLEK